MSAENSGDVDLFGDPIPEGFEGRGRPPHVATERNRNKVMLLIALGWTEPRIAGALGISKPTLKKYYFRELRAREVMLDRLKATHITTLFEQVKAGNIQAIKELGRIIDRIDAARFGIGSDDDDRDEGPATPQTPVGKKEAARLAARTAGQGSAWGNDLLPPEVKH